MTVTNALTIPLAALTKAAVPTVTIALLRRVPPRRVLAGNEAG